MIELEKLFTLRILSVLTLLDKTEQPLRLIDIFNSLHCYFLWYQSLRHTVQTLEIEELIESKRGEYKITILGKKKLAQLKHEYYLLEQIVCKNPN